jgi:hypothetical protein
MENAMKTFPYEIGCFMPDMCRNVGMYTAASYAPKVGNCELRITKKRFIKVLKCLVQNTPKSKVL